MSDAVLSRLRSEVPGWQFKVEYGGLTGHGLNTKPPMTMALDHEPDGWKAIVSMPSWGSVTTTEWYDDPVDCVRHTGARAIMMSDRGIRQLEHHFRNVVWLFEGDAIVGQLSPGHNIRCWPVNKGLAGWNDVLVRQIGWEARLYVKHQNVSATFRTAVARVDAKSAVSELIYAAIQMAAISSHVRMSAEARTNQAGEKKETVRKAAKRAASL